MPSADAVGSKEQLSFSRARLHASTVAMMNAIRKRSHPAPVAMKWIILRSTSMASLLSSGEADVSRTLSPSAFTLKAKLREIPTAAPIAHIPRHSKGTMIAERIRMGGRIVAKINTIPITEARAVYIVSIVV